MRFHSENRSNAISYVTVYDGDKSAGSFALSTLDWSKVKAGLLAVGCNVGEEGEQTPKFLQKPRERKARSSSTSMNSPAAAERADQVDPDPAPAVEPPHEVDPDPAPAD